MIRVFDCCLPLHLHLHLHLAWCTGVGKWCPDWAWVTRFSLGWDGRHRGDGYA